MNKFLQKTTPALFILFFIIVFNDAQSQTRYWVGGTGSWINTAKWSTTSGGAGGASVPLSTDDVVFDAASGTGTLTIPTGATNVAKSLTFLATTSMSVITGAGRLDLTSDLTLKPSMNITGWTGQLFFYTPASVAVTRTITTANNTFRNSLIQFELPSFGVAGNVVVNGDFIHAVGTELVNLQNKSNTVTFNGICSFAGFIINSGTCNMLNGFTEYLPTFLRIALPNGALNSFANGIVNMLDTDGETNLNAGNTLSGNSYTFSIVQCLTNSTANTGTLSIVNCSITVNSIWKYGSNGNTAGIAYNRLLNAAGSTIRMTSWASSFAPHNYTFNNIFCDDNVSNTYLSWPIANYYVAGHLTQPNFNTIILDRNINFAFDNTYLPATVWPTINTLMRLTPNHKYWYTSTKGEAIGSVFRFNIPNGATLDMVGTCDKPIWLDKMAWEFGATAIINSDNIRATNVLATNNTSPYAACSPLKPMGANSYAISGTSTSYAGWDILTTKPTHRNLVWVGNYNTTTTSTISIAPTTPSLTFTSAGIGLNFTVNSKVTLNSVDIFATNTSTTSLPVWSTISPVISGTLGAAVAFITTTIPPGVVNQKYTVTFNTTLNPGNYVMVRSNSYAALPMRAHSGQAYPIVLSTNSTPSVVTITAGNPTVTATNYNYFYNWQIENSSFAGNNNWYDPNNWVDVTALPAWATNTLILPGNAGYAPTCPPTHRDSVIFPNNSYVNCDKLIQYCEGVNWQGTGRIYGTAEKHMEVWGSLYLSAQMQNDFKGTHWFKSDRTYTCSITTNNQSFDLGVVFNSDNGNGKWLLQDSLIVRNADPSCSSGYAYMSSGVTSFKLARGHLMTGTANCTPGNGQTIEVFGMVLDGGTISLYDSDVCIFGEATNQYNFNFVANKNTLVKINGGTSNFIFMDKYNPGALTASNNGSGLPKAAFGSGHRLHEITLKKPTTGAYVDYTNILYLSLDTVAKITAEPGTSPIFGTFLQPGTTGSSITYSAAVKTGGLIRRLDFQSASPAYIAAYQLNTAQFPTTPDNSFLVTIDSLTTNGSINFTQNVNIRSYLKLAAGKLYNLGSTPTGATAISVNLMGASTLTYNPFNCNAPYGASYTGASANITGNCLNYINITNGNFIANSTSTFVADYLNITNNTVTGPNNPFNFSNSNLSGNTTGWAGVTSLPRKLRWKDVSVTNANVGNWNDANYWELITGGTGTQTVIGVSPQCPPTRVDTVLFDNTSFSANNQQVNLPSALTEIGSIYWRNITAGTTPQFKTSLNTNQLDVYASLAFHTNMQQNFSGPILFRGQPSNGASTFSISTITCGNKAFNNKINFQADGINKVWSLQDSLTALNNLGGTFSTSSLYTPASTGNGSFNLIRGEFRTNGKSMYLGTFNSNSSLVRKIDITNSTITINQGYEYSVTYGGNSWIVAGSPSNFSLNSTGSTINFITSAIQGIIGGGKKYNNLNFNGFSSYAGIFGGGPGSITAPTVDRDTFNVVTFTGSGNAFIGRNNGLGGGPYTNSFNRFTKLISNSSLSIMSNSNTFDTLIMNNVTSIQSNNRYNNQVKFSNGKIYNMGSNTVQWFGNRCDVDLIGASGSNIQMYSTTTSQQAYFRKDSGYLCADFINMRDIWAIGNGNNSASCTSFSVSGINTNCTPAASFSTHAVSSCDTIIDLNSACGPWDGINFARGRADFNAGANADLQGNDAGWARRGYPPNPVLTLTSNSYSVCPSQSVTLTFSGIATPPFNMYYLVNGSLVNKTIAMPSDLTTYTASTGVFTYTLAVTPTVSTQYRLGYIVIDRCFNPQSVIGTGTVNVTVWSTPSAVVSNFSPSNSVCNGASVTLTTTAANGSSYVLYPTLTGTLGAMAMANYSVGAAVNGSVVINATGTYSTNNSPSIFTLFIEVTSGYGCPLSPRVPVTFTVNPVPVINNAFSQSICSGNTATIAVLNTFTTGILNTWSSPPLVGITGHSNSGTNSTITETLVNTTTSPITVIYTYTPSFAACIGAAELYTVIVNSLPTINSASLASICSGSALNFSLTSSIGSTYQWAALNNLNTSGETTITQSSSFINDIITSTFTTTQFVLYNIVPTSTLGNCVGSSQTLSVTLNPTPQITSVTNATICSGSTLNIGLTSNLPSTYTWVSASNSNVTGESTTNVSSNMINNTLSTSLGSFSENVFYTVNATSTTGNCLASAQQVTITVNSTPNLIAVSSSSAICTGQTATLTASGASTYNWVGGPSANTYVVSATGIYNVTGTSASGCVNTKTVSVIVNTLPSVGAVSSSSVICNGQTTTLTASGASTYNWVSGPSTNTYAVSSTGIYSVTGTDVNGCVNTQTVSVIVNPLPTISTSTITNVSCYGLNNGSVSFVTSSGTPNYTISGVNIVGNNATALAPNNYTYTVKDAVGCVNDIALTITEPTLVLSAIAAETNSNTSCVSPNGIATVTITGGTPNYIIMSSSGSIIANSINGLTTGLHNYTVTDNRGCTTSNTIQINGVAGISSSITSQTNVLCFGKKTASITVTGLNEATGNYTYSITAITGNTLATVTNTTGNFVNLSSGTYSVLIVGDISNCISTQNITITQPTTSLSISSIATNSALCYGALGTVTLNVIGGTTPYSYVWSGNSSVNSIASYTAGTYSVTVADVNGCFLNNNIFTIIHPTSAITLVNINTSSVVCFGGTGSATVNVTGGISPYSYSWINNTSITNTATYAAGSYSVTISDANGCALNNKNFIISQPSTSLSIASVVTSTASCGLSNGSVTITANGGWNNNYSYFLNSVSIPNAIINNLSAGSYSAAVNDALGCSTSKIFTIANPSSPVINANLSQTSICKNDIVTITPNGASNYTITGSSITSSTVGTVFTVSPSVQGIYTYSIIGTGSSACVSSILVVTLTVNSSQTITVNPSLNSVCAGQSITFTPIGATTYTLVNTNQTITSAVIVTPTTNTTYTINGVDNVGCMAIPAVITVTYNTLPTILIGLSNATICSGSTATLTPSGATSYTLINTNQPINTTIGVMPTLTETYTVTGVNSNGCINTKTITIMVNQTPTVVASTNAPFVCLTNTISLNANAIATNTVSYNWVLGNGITSSNQSQQNPTFSATGLNTVMHVYTVTATQNFCTSLPATVTVSVINNPNADLTSNSLSVCIGSTAIFSVLAPQIGSVYSWMRNGFANTTGSSYSVSANATGVQTITVLVALGSCTNTASATLLVNATPTISISQTTIEICESKDVVFSIANPINNAHYEWSYNNSKGAEITIPKVQMYDAGVYTATVTDVNLCTNTATATLIVNPCNLEITQLVTPNGDGKNDFFEVKNIELYPDNLVQIFNRWGSLVYSSKNYQNNWDGKYQFGKGYDLLPASTYYIVIDFNDEKNTIL